MKFLALDFETADYGRDSACALGMVRVEEGRVAARDVRLIRPPRRRFVFTYLHGISWEDVRGEPTFGELWPFVEPMFRDVDFLVAHNARFDRGVLETCCARAGLEVPPTPFACTMVLARRVWGMHPTNLAHVCRQLGIPLNHHEVSSDVEACAEIMLRLSPHLAPPQTAPARLSSRRTRASASPPDPPRGAPAPVNPPRRGNKPPFQGPAPAA
ncbi:MAG: 3'-5' exonuclease [Bacteroidota bacterium]